MMRPFDRPGPERSTALTVGAAVAWGLLLLVLAWFLPEVTPQSPPVYSQAAPTGLAPTPPATPTPIPTLMPTPSGTLTPEPRVSLVAYDGRAVLLLVAVPTLVSLVVGLLLWLSVSRRSRAAWRAALALAIAAAVAAFVGTVTFLIGLYALPVGGLLIAACGQAPRPPRPSGTGLPMGGPLGGTAA
jgi:hypothetical protein